MKYLINARVGAFLICDITNEAFDFYTHELDPPYVQGTVLFVWSKL